MSGVALTNPEMLALVVTSSCTVFAAFYHLGIRRERVDNIKHGLTLEVRNLRDSNSQRFDRIELRLDSVDRQLAAIQERHAASERWQGSVETKLEAQETRLARLEQREVA